MAGSEGAALPERAPPGQRNERSPARRPEPAPVRVFVCDDSAVIRAVLGRVLGGADDIVVVGQAVNGQDAVDRFRASPGCADVLVLDIEMPLMDGLTALPLLLRAAPGLRVIIASTLSTHGATTTLEALRLGAHDYVPKPSAAALTGDVAFQRELVGKVRGLGRRPARAGSTVIPLRPFPTTKPRLLGIGSSTGGPQALLALLRTLGAKAGPAGLGIPIILTQHMPAAFTPLLAEQLSRGTGLSCAEAQDGAVLAPGRVHVAPGGRHLTITGGPGGLLARLDDGPAENFCRPSVDPMLRSAAQATAGRMLMLMLTGMGHDGLEGTQALVAAGGAAMAQDEASSVVWGMPGAIARAGLCSAVLPLPALAARTVELLRAAA